MKEFFFPRDSEGAFGTESATRGGCARLWAELRRLWARGSGAPKPFFLVVRNCPANESSPSRPSNPSNPSSSSACHSPATQIDLRPSTGSATVSTRAAAAQALLAQHLGCLIKPPQTAASLLAQPEQRHCYYASCCLLLVIFLIL